MSGHIRKARFNDNNKNARKDNYPNTRHTDHLTVTTWQTRPHTPDSFNSQIIKEKEKGVATSLLAVAHCWPLASLVSRRHLDSVGTSSWCARTSTRQEPAPRKHKNSTQSVSSTRKKEEEPPLFVPFIHSSLSMSRIQRPGGRSHACPLVGRKGGVSLFGSGHCTRGSAMFTKTKSLGRRFRRPFGVVLQPEEEEEEVEAMVGGCGKMAAV